KGTGYVTLKDHHGQEMGIFEIDEDSDRKSTNRKGSVLICTPAKKVYPLCPSNSKSPQTNRLQRFLIHIFGPRTNILARI
ncbi:RIKEN cDNA 2610001J05, partial [Mus musculus]